MSDSFLSIVQHKDKLLVRARKRGDIERVFPKATVQVTLQRDYPYRATVSRHQVGQALVAEVVRINYGNIKNSVADIQRHNAYLDCWVAMQRWGDNGTT